MYLSDICFDVGLDLLLCGSKIHFSDRTFHTYALKIENQAKSMENGSDDRGLYHISTKDA